MFVILPFEEEFYQRFDYKVDFVGHPLLDAVQQYAQQKEQLVIPESKKVIALLPGSRRQEISTMLPLMLQMKKYYPEHLFIVAGAPSQPQEYYETLVKDKEVRIVFNRTYQLLQKAE